MPGDLKPRNNFTYHLGKSALSPVMRIIFRPKIIGKNNVPLTGAVILASNHLSFIDSVVIPVVAPRPVRFLAKSHYFEGKGIRGFITKSFFRSIGAVPVHRGAGSAAQDALDQGKNILESGEAFALYPEGTRSRDGKLYRGRTGVAWLALTTGAVVVPVGLIGTDKIQPVGTKTLRIKKVTVVFGEPLDLSHHGLASSGKSRRHATDEIMKEIALLSGQEVVNQYNEVPQPKGLHRIAEKVFPRERL